MSRALSLADVSRTILAEAGSSENLVTPSTSTARHTRVPHAGRESATGSLIPISLSFAVARLRVAVVPISGCPLERS